MFAISLYLGNVEFAIDELPEEIPLGGTQALAVKKYVGGEIDIQTLGPFDDPISWEGVLWFTNALDRVQTLNDMRISGDPVILQVGTMSCNVVISKFTFKYRNDYYIPYQIELQPAELLATIGSASTITGQQTAQGGTTTATQTSASPAALANLASVATKYTPQTQFGAAATTLLGTIISVMSPPGGAVSIAQPQIMHLAGAGETLWSIAAKYYKDGTKWTTIAIANNIKNPNGITVGQKLTVPNPVVMT